MTISTPEGAPGGPRRDGGAHHAVPAAAPALPRGRAFTPDIARGLMLLLVMIANSTSYITAREPGLLGRPVDPAPLDRVVDVIAVLFIENRAYPMFAFLFAYGIHQIANRETSRGASRGRVAGLLARRNAWLFLFGTVHFLVLFAGDIMMNYAVCGFVLILLVRAPKWVLWLIFGISLVPFTIVSGNTDMSEVANPREAGTQIAETIDPFTAQTLTEVLLARVQLFPTTLLLTLFLTPLVMLAPMSLGLLFARLSILERPWERPRLVAALGWGGLAAAVLGGLPFAQGLAFGFEPGPHWWFPSALSNLTGIFAGIGWTCLIALALSRRQREHDANPAARPGPVGSALQALGKRSMSGYIAQSICSVTLFPPYALGLGGQLGTFGMTMISIAIWATTLAAAVILERLGKPGPMEWLFRRLSYGRR